MEQTEIQLKKLIMLRYGSIKKFCETINMPWTTLDSILKRGVANSNITNVLKITKELNLNAESLANGVFEYNGLTADDIYVDNKETTEREIRYEHSLNALHLARDIESSDNMKLLEAYNKLNDAGKEEAIKRIEELAEINRYRKRPKPHFSVAGSARRAAAAQLAKLGEATIYTQDSTQKVPLVVTLDPTGIAPSTVVAAEIGPAYRNPRKPPIMSANQTVKNEAKQQEGHK